MISNGKINRDSKVEDEGLIHNPQNGNPQAFRQQRVMSMSAQREVAENNWVPPDGGWGWLCVIACFFTLALLVGMSRSFGIIYNEVLAAFPDTKHIQIAMIPSMVVTLTVGFGIVAGPLSMAYSCRSVAFVGGLFGGLGISLNFFAMSALYMQFCFFIAGIGAGMACNPGVIIVAKYFRKRRTQAVGFSLAGTAVGTIVQPPLMQYLVDEYGFRGALLLQGGILLHVCAGALLYRDPIPKKKPRIENNITHQESKTITTKVTAEEGELLNSKLQVLEGYQRGKEGRYSTKPGIKTNPCFQWVERHLYLDLTLFYNPVFLIIAFSTMFLAAGYPQSLVYIPPYAISVGFSKYASGVLLSISSVGDLIGRILSGFIFDRNLIRKQVGYIISTMVLSCSLMGAAVFQSYIAIAVCVFLYGFFAGATFILIPVLLTEHHGAPKLASSYGIVRSFQAIACLLGPPLAGYIKDETGSFSLSLLTLGAITTLSSVIMCCIIPLKRKYRYQTKSSTLTML